MANLKGVQLDFNITSTDCNFDVSSLADVPNFEILMPLILLTLTLISSTGSIWAMYKIWKHAEIYFINSASPLSLTFLTLLNFQFFGVFMVLGLSYAPQYFQYLTVAGVNCFLASVTINKLSFLFFMSQNSEHPLINVSGIRSPRVRFYILVIICEGIFFILGFVFLRFKSFSIYISCFYAYPLIHILNAVYNGNRNNFRW